MRRKLFYFLKAKIFKIPEGERIAGLLLLIKYFLFPLYSLCCKIKNINYDFEIDVYTINGIKLHGDFFYMLNNLDIGEKFKIIKRNDSIITIERVIN